MMTTTNPSPSWAWVRLINRMSAALAVLGAIACIVMSAQVFVDVLTRTIARAPLPGTLDFVTYIWMPVLVFSGFALAELRREHITMDLVTQGLRGRAASVARIVAGAISIVVMAILLVFSVQAALDSVALQQATFGTVHVAVWPIKLFMVVGLALMLLQMIANVVHDAVGQTVQDQEETA
jgi:TRAP-type C4-dicarboxylate transport system, small permease component